MKNFFCGLILCTALHCGCSAVYEENFSNKEIIKRAKEICFEKAHDEIEDHNEYRQVKRGIYKIKIESAEDIFFPAAWFWTLTATFGRYSK
ncbi:MAG: hypothetical protein K2H90_05640 [Oscillospiraceae bacterium]|nr:hypothetical protein [Oscillospiraceae bacterium]